jgi:hypothetical protein
MGLVAVQHFLTESLYLDANLLKPLSFVIQELFVGLVGCLCKVEYTFDRALHVDYEVATTAEWTKNLYRNVTVILLKLNRHISELVMALKLSIYEDSNNSSLSLSESATELGCKH